MSRIATGLKGRNVRKHNIMKEEEEKKKESGYSKRVMDGEKATPYCTR